MKLRISLLTSMLVLAISMMFCVVGKSHADDTTIKDIDCSNPKDQASMGICQGMKTEKAEKELKIVSDKVAKTMQGGRKELFENYQKPGYNTLPQSVCLTILNMAPCLAKCWAFAKKSITGKELGSSKELVVTKSDDTQQMRAANPRQARLADAGVRFSTLI